jgi:hypothetical protein
MDFEMPEILGLTGPTGKNRGRPQISSTDSIRSSACARGCGLGHCPLHGSSKVSPSGGKERLSGGHHLWKVTIAPVRIVHRRRLDRELETNSRFAPTPDRHRYCELHDGVEDPPHRADDVSGESSRIMGLTKFLGAVLVLVVLGTSVQAVQSVTLAWDPCSDPAVVGYAMYYGVASRTYTNMVDAGNATNATISGLVGGTTYFFAVTAHHALGLESDYSNEVSYSVPTGATNPPPTIALASPANGASYTAPATINWAASVTANGHSIIKVQFYNGATLLGEDSSSPYSFIWSNVNSGSFSLTARAVYDAGSTVDSSPVNLNVTDLPAPWQTVDVGSVGVVGSASMSNGIYTVKGAGNISGLADNFRFVYQPLSGDGEIKVRLNSVETNGTTGRIGVMIRESLTSGSEYAFMGTSPDGRFCWQRRGKTGGLTSSTTSTIGTPPNVWMRLVRTGKGLFGYQSTDGTTWTQVSSRSVTMAPNIYVGLAVASGSSNTLNTATFSNITVAP